MFLFVLISDCIMRRLGQHTRPTQKKQESDEEDEQSRPDNVDIDPEMELASSTRIMV